MKTLQITLTDESESALTRHARETGYEEPGAYVEALVQAHFAAAEGAQSFMPQDRLERELLRGLDSGEPIPMTAGFWREARAELRRRLEERKRSAE